MPNLTTFDPTFDLDVTPDVIPPAAGFGMVRPLANVIVIKTGSTGATITPSQNNGTYVIAAGTLDAGDIIQIAYHLFNLGATPAAGFSAQVCFDQPGAAAPPAVTPPGTRCYSEAFAVDLDI